MQQPIVAEEYLAGVDHNILLGLLTETDLLIHLREVKLGKRLAMHLPVPQTGPRPWE